MPGLFDIPGARSSREADKAVAKKSRTKSASVISTKGSSILDRITLIRQTVEQKLGKYKDEYDIITDKECLEKYIQKCIENGICAVDTETTGLNSMLDKIAGLCLYTPGEKAVYIPINHESYITGLRIVEQLTEADVAIFVQMLVDAKVKLIMHNGSFDCRVIKHQLGVVVTCYFDTQLAANILNENEPHQLKVLHQKYVLEGVGDAWTFGALFDNIPFTKIPINTAYLYAARDPKITYELYEWQLPYLTIGTKECTEQELEGSSNVFWNIEMPFLPVVVEMEDNGISMDLDYQKQLSEKYGKLREEKLQVFYDSLSEYQDKIDKYIIRNPGAKLASPINIASPQQLSILFYDILGCESVDRKSPRGTGEEILQKLNAKYKLPICKAILDYRGVDKLINTYVDKLPDVINPNTGKIHAHFNQYGAKTGRLSSSDPNMQNIPSHNKDIRKMFVASVDETLIDAVEDAYFEVYAFDEVKTNSGWKSAKDIAIGDTLVIVEDSDNTTHKIIVTKIDKLIDKNHLLLYYT